MTTGDAVGVLAAIVLWCLVLIVLGAAVGALIQMWKNRR